MEQPNIKGYVQLTQEKADLVNSNKDIEKHLMDQIDSLMENVEVDARSLNIARTQLQTGFMWLTRAICNPTQ